MSLLNNKTFNFLAGKLMSCVGVAFILFILSAAFSCNKPAVEPSPELEGGNLQESIAAQKRINQYFSSEVLPKLKTCWDRVQGHGTIEMKYRFENDAKGGWAFKSLEIGKSDLSQDKNTAALACMKGAVDATRFSRDASDVGDSYLIDWVWPVPLPPDTDQQMARMFGASGGEGTGCDGHGAPAKCMTCSGYPVECKTVCVGEEPPCTIKDYGPGSGGLKACVVEGKKCASGGLFGVVGGVIMY
ncbi:MAG: hypothetical protein AB1598_07725 [Thermodesulfobacteriota bacterium]